LHKTRKTFLTKIKLRAHWTVDFSFWRGWKIFFLSENGN